MEHYDNANSAEGGQAKYNDGFAQAAPQPGGYYQYVPGGGFMPVQGFTNGYATQAPGMAPPNAQAAMGFPQGFTQGTAQAPNPQAGTPGTPEGAEPKFDQKKMGELYGMFTDAMNGEADPARILGFLQDSGGDFWKGALVGAAAVFLVNNDMVKGAVAGTFGSFFGNRNDAAEAEGKED